MRVPNKLERRCDYGKACLGSLLCVKPENVLNDSLNRR